MKICKKHMASTLVIFLGIISFAFKNTSSEETYASVYASKTKLLRDELKVLLSETKQADLKNKEAVESLQKNILKARIQLKKTDFWLRYLEPLAYKKINGPLPVEWETEVFEKFEKPYKREGAGLTLAALYLEEENASNDSLYQLVNLATSAADIYTHDSITALLRDPSNFWFCNRLHLLNLASIYTTGFECPNPEAVIPELLLMMQSTEEIYAAYNESFPSSAVSPAYLSLYKKAIGFVQAQPAESGRFDHFGFIKNYVNPLFALNQLLILQHRAMSKSTLDYALSKQAKNIFSKNLYEGQNSKGVYYNVIDPDALAAIDKLGKLFFYDPILSGNNQRSCASCHKPKEFFTDTSTATSLQFNHTGLLARNTPSLLNAGFNHLAMLDGAHISLQNQTRAVLTNPLEMAATEQGIMEKVLSCASYKKELTKLLAYTPQEPVITFDHIVSAITFYYSKFSNATSGFDLAMQEQTSLNADAVEGFNLFMSKAQCATCHFTPQFNGVKPPFIGSEFEVLGTPADPAYKSISGDKGRYLVNPAQETMNAFRTGSLRNIMHTAPYMHNGVFKTMDEVIDFYDAGGGAGHGLQVSNQTLAADSLHLDAREKQKLIAFLASLTESIPFEDAPKKLPSSSIGELNNRIVGGIY
jgi:cytochrome c peroxidase